MDLQNAVARFRLGDPQAIAAVTRLARTMVGERGYYIPLDERQDVIQEILISVHTAVCSPSFRIRHGFEAFVRSVAHRRCVDWLKHRMREVPLESDPPSPAPGPDGPLIHGERKRIALLALQSLGSSCRRLIQLRFGLGLSHREIAERLGRTEIGVRVQMHKCLRQARDLLSQFDGGEDYRA